MHLRLHYKGTVLFPTKEFTLLIIRKLFLTGVRLSSHERYGIRLLQIYVNKTTSLLRSLTSDKRLPWTIVGHVELITLGTRGG